MIETKTKIKASMRKVGANVYIDTYNTQYDLCMSFLRVQEFYESPEFKGRYFTLEEFMDWWSFSQSKIKGSFDYPIRWSGFNIPGEVILDWLFKCDEDILSNKEIALLNRLAKKLKVKTDDANQAFVFYTLLKDKLKGIYLIGCDKEDGGKAKKGVLDHELAHAFYNLYPEYKESCIKLLTEMGHNEDDKLIRECVHDNLIKMGYHESVIEDEMQAYFSTGDDFGIRSEFIDNFNQFRKKIK